MKCGRCSKLYSQSRKPLIFPCGHSFCSFCFLEQTVDLCPDCGQEGKIVVNYALYQEVMKSKNNHIEKYIKVCLFGNANVGKSSLIKRIVDDQFDENINPTIGIDFRYKDVQVNSSIFRFQLWDSVGQEKYRSMVSQHLKGSDIVFLLYDLNEQAFQNSLEYWFKEIENNVQHSNIIVIGNKQDEKEMNQKENQNFESITSKEKDYIEKNKWKHFQISCKTGTNLQNLFSYVVNISKVMKTKAQIKQKSVILSSKVTNKKQPQNQPKNQNKCSC